MQCLEWLQVFVIKGEICTNRTWTKKKKTGDFVEYFCRQETELNSLEVNSNTRQEGTTRSMHSLFKIKQGHHSCTQFCCCQNPPNFKKGIVRLKKRIGGIQDELWETSQPGGKSCLNVLWCVCEHPTCKIFIFFFASFYWLKVAWFEMVTAW